MPRPLLAFFGALALLLALPATVGASTGFEPSDPIPSPAAFAVRGTHGYTISVFADLGRGPQSSRVLVSALGRHGRVSVSARADLTEEGIRADLGRFGRVDMAWVPNGQPEETRTRCRSFPPTAVWFAGGEYVGSFSFHGEKDFTSVEVSAVDGRKGWWRYLQCGYVTNEGYPGSGILLDAERSSQGAKEGSYRFLSIVQNHPGEKVSYYAEIGEKSGPLQVSRAVYGLGGRGTLRVRRQLEKAEVRPPFPFSGRGVFERVKRRGPGTWRGNLSADFPGRTRVLLAGRAWSATLVHGFRESEPQRLAHSQRPIGLASIPLPSTPK
ncbi:MAG TPA: hypothetical protein VFJ61_07155 [Solirubrobacterales bacterium]|nr:hypothetical protein [Solirubrobacterales bacterium]